MAALLKVVSCALAGLLCLSQASPAHAQFGGLRDILGSRSNNNSETAEPAQQTPEECAQDSTPSVGRQILGGLLGSAGRQAANRIGIPLFVPMKSFTDQLSTAIACRLDPQEQEQAAEATLEATRLGDDDSSPEIGTTAEWVSETRGGVSGRSTVTGHEGGFQGMDCITVTDIIIVEGEETRDDKRMCRTPPGRRYALLA